MSETRSAVLTLLKQFDRQFTAFDGVEEGFMLALARGEKPTAEQTRAIDWQKLSKATFVLPHCYLLFRQGVLCEMPDWFLEQAKVSYLQLISSNEARLKQIQQLARLFDEAGLKVLFLKGAAELAYGHQDVDFLGRRQMTDIDLLCPVDTIDRADELLRANGYQLWDLGLKHWSEEQIRQFSLSRYSHYIYNAYGRNYMELHGHVAVGQNRASYPPDFEELLVDQAQEVDVRGTAVWVPKPEHLVAYAACHAASRSNNQELVYLDRFYLDDFAGTDCVVSPPGLINKRLDLTQLKFLLQTRDLLNRFSGKLSFAELKQLFSRVGERGTNDMYTLAAAYAFREGFPIVEKPSLEALELSRQRYVSLHMMPLLAERIESIIEGRLQRLTEAFIEQQVERISVTVERRVVHSVTERIVEIAKSALGKRVKKIIS